MNPYDFVRFGRPGLRELAITHERFQEHSHSGQFLCCLTARTHLFIPKTQEVPGRSHAELALMRGLDGVPLLPGSSLKGVIRSVAEAISGSCLTLPQARRGEVDYRGRPPVSYQVPCGFEHCRDADHLCPACRVFGSLSGGNPFLGKVGIGDARATSDVNVEWLTIEALMEPKPRHKVWYEDPQQHDVMRGRKFYYHRPLGPRTTPKKTQYNKTVEAVKPGTVFEFGMEYTNLTDDELALLVFALVLEPEMCHKVGMGKPVGLGSAKIEIVHWEQVNRQARYRQLGGGVSPLEGEALAAEIERWRARYHQAYANSQESLSDLRCIWTWDPAVKEDVGYPSRDWFRQNRDTPIEKAP
jgi:CRISPR/Cas system CSM-associated protein Csm3 (group 7 of RAMP superfamily)